jgi:hypothetical protein
MNIIKAGKALQAGKVVANESGFEYKAENDGGSRVLIRAFGSGEWQPAELFYGDLLSEKWAVVDE